MLTENALLQVVKNTPLVSIDLVLRNEDDAILMGLRTNQPAQGYWFVPGGRIRKNERIEAAFARIAEFELGVPVGFEQAKLLGAFTHIYDSNFAQAPGIGTHYVVLAYELRLPLKLADLPDAQHSAYRWVSCQDDLAGVHENASAYFDYLTP